MRGFRLGREDEEALAEGVTNDLGLVAQTKLTHDVTAMDFDGARTDEEQLRNLGIALTLGRELEDLALAGAQGLIASERRFRGALHVGGDCVLGNLRTEEPAA